MNSGDRFFLFIVALALGVIGLTVVAAMLGAMDNLQSLLVYLGNEAKWETVTVAAIAVLASLYLLALATRTTQERGVVNETTLGTVKINLKTIESLVLRAANQVKGVKEVQPSVEVVENALKVGVDVLVTPDVCIPEVAGEVQQRIGEYVKSSVGISVSDVRVNVKGLSSEGKARVG